MGQRKGYKQSPEHIERRKMWGENNPQWKGENISVKSGRSRALRRFTKKPCEICGEPQKVDRHHVDGNTKNNEPSNLRYLCRRCHMIEDGRMALAAEKMRAIQPLGVASRWT